MSKATATDPWDWGVTSGWEVTSFEEAWKVIKLVKEDNVVSLFTNLEKVNFDHQTKRYCLLTDDQTYLILDTLLQDKWSWKRVCAVLEKLRIRRKNQELSWSPDRSSQWYRSRRRKLAIQGVETTHRRSEYQEILRLKGQKRTWKQIAEALNKNFGVRSWTSSKAQSFYRSKHPRKKPGRRKKKTATKAKKLYSRVKKSPAVASSSEVTVVKPFNGRAILLFKDVQLDIIRKKSGGVSVEALWIEDEKITQHTFSS